MSNVVHLSDLSQLADTLHVDLIREQLKEGRHFCITQGSKYSDGYTVTVRPKQWKGVGILVYFNSDVEKLISHYLLTQFLYPELNSLKDFGFGRWLWIDWYRNSIDQQKLTELSQCLAGNSMPKDSFGKNVSLSNNKSCYKRFYMQARYWKGRHKDRWANIMLIYCALLMSKASLLGSQLSAEEALAIFGKEPATKGSIKGIEKKSRLFNQFFLGNL